MVYRACVLTFFLNPALCASFHLLVFPAFSQRENLCFYDLCPQLHGDLFFVHVVWFWPRLLNIHVPNYASAGCTFFSIILRKNQTFLGFYLQSSALLHLHIARRVSAVTRLDIDTQERRIEKILQRSIKGYCRR